MFLVPQKAYFFFHISQSYYIHSFKNISNLQYKRGSKGEISIDIFFP